MSGRIGRLKKQNAVLKRTRQSLASSHLGTEGGGMGPLEDPSSRFEQLSWVLKRDTNITPSPLRETKEQPNEWKEYGG